MDVYVFFPVGSRERIYVQSQRKKLLVENITRKKEKKTQKNRNLLKHNSTLKNHSEMNSHRDFGVVR